MGKSFQASRFTHGNFLWPTVIEVTGESVIRRKRRWFSVDEMSIHLKRVASVHIETGLVWAQLRIESTGGGDDIESHGHSKGDAREIKALIEQGQSTHLDGRADP